MRVTFTGRTFHLITNLMISSRFYPFYQHDWNIQINELLAASVAFLVFDYRVWISALWLCIIVIIWMWLSDYWGEGGAGRVINCQHHNPSVSWENRHTFLWFCLVENLVLVNNMDRMQNTVKVKVKVLVGGWQTKFNVEPWSRSLSFEMNLLDLTRTRAWQLARRMPKERI